MKTRLITFLPWALVIILVPILIYCYFWPVQQTTIILVRHAEKTGSELTDPLTRDGFDRADELAFVLQEVPLDAIYASQYLRTQQTVNATATDQGLSLTSYTASSDVATVTSFLDGILSAHRGGYVLIAGHSNTVPVMVNVLTGSSSFGDIDDSDYENLYVLDVISRGNAKLKHLHHDKE